MRSSAQFSQRQINCEARAGRRDIPDGGRWPAKCPHSTLMEISYEYGVVGLRTDTLTDR